MPPDAPAVPDRSETWFADDRGIERRLKVSWHPEHRLFVLSVWHRDRCTATIRLPVADVPRLIGTLADGLGRAAAGATSSVAARAANLRRPRRRYR